MILRKSIMLSKSISILPLYSTLLVPCCWYCLTEPPPFLKEEKKYIFGISVIIQHGLAEIVSFRRQRRFGPVLIHRLHFIVARTLINDTLAECQLLMLPTAGQGVTTLAKVLREQP